LHDYFFFFAGFELKIHNKFPFNIPIHVSAVEPFVSLHVTFLSE
jgi:hypothetical protein